MVFSLRTNKSNILNFGVLRDGDYFRLTVFGSGFLINTVSMLGFKPKKAAKTAGDLVPFGSF
jgi:hypothetical protein